MDKSPILELASQFVPLSDTTKDALLSLFSPRKLDKGAYFVREGQFSYELAFIDEGVLRAYYIDPKGTEYNKTFFPKHTFAISLASALQQIPSYLNFDALLDTSIWVADYRELTKLFQEHRSIETLVRKVIEYEWVIKKEQRELRLVVNNAEERYRFFQKEYPGLESKIPQYHIASHLGITPIQLSRIRAKLARQK